MTESKGEKRNTVPQRRWFALGVWAALIFVTSSVLVPLPTFIHFVQGLIADTAYKQEFAQFWRASWFFVVKGWHATEYAILLGLCAMALQARTQGSRRKSIGTALVLVILFAASDEWHQTFVPGRDGCVRDVLIDATGASIAALFLLTRRASRRTVRTV